MAGAAGPLGAAQFLPLVNKATWFSFTQRGTDHTPTLISVAPLLLDHAGDDPVALIDRRGFVTTDANGHFVFRQSGQRVRFWGVNLSFGANFPASPAYPPGTGEGGNSQDAEQLAARLAKLGFNAVRLHLFDSFNRPDGIWQAAQQNTQALDPVQLGRLDYLIYQLKRHTIYVDLNLHVARAFQLGDGVTVAPELASYGGDYIKQVTLFDPLLIALQKEYAAQLLTHVNPYTKLAYKDEPAIFATETSNEDSFFLGLINGQLNWAQDNPQALPHFYSQELDGWSTLSAGPTLNRLVNPAFSAGLAGWFYTGQASATMITVTPGVDPALRVAITSTGKPVTLEFGQRQLAVQQGHLYELRFAARALQPAILQGRLLLDHAPGTNLGWHAQIPINTTWQAYTFTFTATASVFGEARLTFDLAARAPNTLWFDHFVWRETEVFRGWQGWLAAKYGSTSALAAAWTPTQTITSTELIANGNFGAEAKGWELQTHYAAKADFSFASRPAPADGQALQIKVTQPGAEVWHVQVYAPQLPIQAGQRYHITFAAKTDAPGPIAYNVSQNHEPWQGLGFDGRGQLTQEWQTFEADFMASADDDNGRVVFDLGQAARTIWLARVSLRPYTPTGLLPEERLETNNIARLPRSQWLRFSDQRVRDLIQFYGETEAAFFGDMRTYLQTTLGSQALNTGTADYFDHLPQLAGMAATDFIDNHLYWDHPAWPDGKPWRSTGWLIRNESWLNAPFEGFFDKAVLAVQGKPFTISEFNTIAPNRYAVEGPLLMATLANLQDWDGVFFYTYAKSQADYQAAKAVDFFSIVGNPIATGLLPVAARLFLARQTAPAPTITVLNFTAEEGLESVMLGWRGGTSDFLWSVKGVQPSAVFGSRLRIEHFTAPAPVAFKLPTPAGPTYPSAGGELTWDVAAAGRGRYLIDAPHLQGVVGFIRDQIFPLHNLQLEIPAAQPNEPMASFGAITLQSLSDAPISTAGQLLLGVFTRFENTNSQWNETYTSLNDHWGDAPALIEPMRFVAVQSMLRSVKFNAEPQRKSQQRLHANGASWRWINFFARISVSS
ncbi:MAG: carbohydrate binding domain-containing protein [Chloroflexi bacterium]|nr:carbohydrate binding domain-containing protein [Chloroflexota bacterium]